MTIELEDIVKLYNRIDELEKRVAQLEAKNGTGESEKKEGRPIFPVECGNGKYQALSEYLYESWEKRIVLSYDEIEDILGFELPASAHTVPQSFWANTKYHNYAKSWLLLGYKAKVNVKTKNVSFERSLY